MKRVGFVFGLILLIILCSFKGLQHAFAPQWQEADVKPLRTMKNNAFKRGEVLKFRLHYGFIDAGVAELKVTDENKKFGSRSTYHVIGTGRSRGTFDWFFKVRDRYETYIDEDAIIPWFFIRRVDEGGFKIEQDYIFNHYANTVDIGGGEKFDIPENTQDMLSAFYAARCIDFSNAKEGDIFELTSFVDRELFPMKIKFVGKETIKSDVGKVKCLRFVPVVQKGRVFKDEEDLRVWISDDNNHVPIRVQANLLVGSIKMDLTGYENLASPLAKEK